MFKRLPAILMLLTVLISINQTVFSRELCTWDGQWKTVKGPLNLTLKPDETVEGNLGKNITIEGISSGRVFIGNWHNSNDNTRGKVNFIMSEDCNSLTADWRNSISEVNIHWSLGAFTGERVKKVNIHNPKFDLTSNLHSLSVDGALLKVNLPANWSYKKDKNNNYSFTNSKYGDKVSLILTNKTFSYSSNNEKNKFIEKQLADAQNVGMDNVYLYVKNIKGFQVNEIKIKKDKNITTITFLDTGNSFYKIKTVYSNEMNDNEADVLFDNIISAIANINKKFAR